MGISPSHFISRKFVQVSFSSGSRFPYVCLCVRGIYCTSSLSTLCTSYFNDLCVCHIIRSQVGRQSRSHPGFRHQQIVSRSKEQRGCRILQTLDFRSVCPSFGNSWMLLNLLPPLLICDFSDKACFSWHFMHFYAFPSQ